MGSVNIWSNISEGHHLCMDSSWPEEESHIWYTGRLAPNAGELTECFNQLGFLFCILSAVFEYFAGRCVLLTWSHLPGLKIVSDISDPNARPFSGQRIVLHCVPNTGGERALTNPAAEALYSDFWHPQRFDFHLHLNWIWMIFSRESERSISNTLRSLHFRKHLYIVGWASYWWLRLLCLSGW